MEVLESIITLLQFKMKTPTLYGWFHLLAIFLTIVLAVYLIKNKKDDQKVLLVLSFIMIMFEIYKQFSFSYNDFVWEYDWDSFPFQFCSPPMYIALIASLTKNEKIKDYLYSFLATFGLIAGISVMLYPSTVFISEVLIDIQTMVHHGFMVVMGAYLLTTNKVSIRKNTILKAAVIFSILVLIALLGNIITYHLGIGNGLELFYISPYHTTILPVFEMVYPHVPYIVFLLLYMMVFTVGASIPLLVCKLLKKRMIHNVSKV